MQKDYLGTIYIGVSDDFQHGLYPIARCVKASTHDLATVEMIKLSEGVDMRNDGITIFQQESKKARKQESKKARKQESKKARKQASKKARKQASKLRSLAAWTIPWITLSRVQIGYMVKTAVLRQ